MYANDSKIGKKVLTLKVKIGTAISKEFCFRETGLKCAGEVRQAFETSQGL